MKKYSWQAIRQIAFHGRTARIRREAKKYSEEVCDLLKEFGPVVEALEKVNVPPVKYPHSTSTSVIAIGPKGCEPDSDRDITYFMSTFRIELLAKLGQAKVLLKAKR